jgi:hypothetical protein
MSLSFASDENCCSHTDAICRVHSSIDTAQHNRYLEQQSLLVQDKRAILEYANFKPSEIKIKGVRMKATIDSLNVILAVENITLDNCHLVAQLMIQENASLAEALMDEIHAQITFLNMGKEEFNYEGYREIKG